MTEPHFIQLEDEEDEYDPVISIINEDKLLREHLISDEDGEYGKEIDIIDMPSITIDRKCLLRLSRNDFMMERLKTLKLLDRNMFRMEVKLFMLLIDDSDYYNMYQYTNRVVKCLYPQGESCIVIDSQNPQLKLTL